MFSVSGCQSKKQKIEQKSEDKTEKSIALTAGNDVIMPHFSETSPSEISSSETDDENEEEQRETRLRYCGFTLIFHDFKSYDNYNEVYIREFLVCDEYWKETATGYIQTKEILIVEKDTVNLYESEYNGQENLVTCFRLNVKNVIIQIVPKNKDDKFKVFQSCLSNLVEVVDRNKYYFDDNGKRRTDEEDELFSKSLAHFDEKTPYMKLEDSSGFYFRTKPFPDDNGNIDEINKWRREQYFVDILRIKKKYKLKDTLVDVGGEGLFSAILTKDKRLFSYSYWAYIFRIEHFKNGKKIATKYIIVHMWDDVCGH
jgi:hypothetical protein